MDALEDIYRRMHGEAAAEIGSVLRDHLAALAMRELVAIQGRRPDEVACMAYAVADAMLRERAKVPPPR